MADDPRQHVDALIDSPGREGLTGTAPADMYARRRDSEQITIAPDGRPMHEQPAWRTDFPIDWPQDHYVERREFMKFMVLTSLAFTVGQVWIAGQSWWRRRRAAPATAAVVSLAEVPVGGTVAFAYPTEHDPCVLIRPSEDVLVAYAQKCTHLSCAVVPRVDEGIIWCPCHEGVFDLGSGRPVAGPPRRPLSRIVLEVRDARVYATGVEERTA